MTIKEINVNNYIIYVTQTEYQYLITLTKNRNIVNMFIYRKIVNGHLINPSIFLPRNPKFSKP